MKWLSIFLNSPNFIQPLSTIAAEFFSFSIVKKQNRYSSFAIPSIDTSDNERPPITWKRTKN